MSESLSKLSDAASAAQSKLNGILADMGDAASPALYAAIEASVDAERAVARKRGRIDGYEEGREVGFDDGKSEGHAKGYREGINRNEMTLARFERQRVLPTLRQLENDERDPFTMAAWRKLADQAERV